MQDNGLRKHETPKRVGAYVAPETKCRCTPTRYVRQKPCDSRACIHRQKKLTDWAEPAQVKLTDFEAKE